MMRKNDKTMDSCRIIEKLKRIICSQMSSSILDLLSRFMVSYSIFEFKYTSAANINEIINANLM